MTPSRRSVPGTYRPATRDVTSRRFQTIFVGTAIFCFSTAFAAGLSPTALMHDLRSIIPDGGRSRERFRM